MERHAVRLGHGLGMVAELIVERQMEFDRVGGKRRRLAMDRGAGDERRRSGGVADHGFRDGPTASAMARHDGAGLDHWSAGDRNTGDGVGAMGHAIMESLGASGGNDRPTVRSAATGSRRLKRRVLATEGAIGGPRPKLE